MRERRKTSANPERLWREQVAAIVGEEELRRLAVPSLGDTAGWIAVLWGEVIVLLVLANLLPAVALPIAIPAGIVLVLALGTRMNAFGVVLHEGSHGLLASNRKTNDRVCNWLVAFWTVNSVEEYRLTHRLHHRYLGQLEDPDRVFYLVPARHGALTFLILQDLVGVTAFRRATSRLAGTSDVSGAPASLLARPGLLVGKAVTQLVVLGALMAVRGPALGAVVYVVFWLVPIVCIYPMILRLKTITEHYDPRLHGPGIRWIARSNAAGAVQNHLIGARMEFHFEHHVVPTIPYRGLKRLHADLDAAGLFRDHPELVSEGYELFLARALVNSLSASRSAAN